MATVPGGDRSERRPWTADYRMRRAGRPHDLGPRRDRRSSTATTASHDFVQGVLYDVTERKLAEQALRESRAARARGGRTPARARRDEEHLPGRGLPRAAEPAHVDPGPRAHPRARRRHRRRTTASDLLARLAANARKLDRLLKDLLDIDRLNRGIVEPQYRTTDVGALARRTVETSSSSPAATSWWRPTRSMLVGRSRRRSNGSSRTCVLERRAPHRARPRDLARGRARGRRRRDRGRGRRPRRSRPSSATRSSSRSARDPRPPPTPPAPASASRSSRGSPSCTAGGLDRGPRGRRRVVPRLPAGERRRRGRRRRLAVPPNTLTTTGSASS